MSETDDRRSQPLDRVFLVLEAVAASQRAVTITEIAKVVDLPPPTVHRLVNQLLERDILKRAIDSKKVLPGSRMVALGSAILAGAFLADRTHVILNDLAMRLKEHCQIGVPSRSEVLYVASARADRRVGLEFNPGLRAPLHCTSIGKLFLASLPPEGLDAWLETTPLPAMTANTIVSPQQLREEIARVRERGWASSNSEYVEGVVGCAVPIRKCGRFVAGLGVSVPSARLDPTRFEILIPDLSAAAEAIARTLG